MQKGFERLKILEPFHGTTEPYFSTCDIEQGFSTGDLLPTLGMQAPVFCSAIRFKTGNNSDLWIAN